MKILAFVLFLCCTLALVEQSFALNCLGCEMTDSAHPCNFSYTCPSTAQYCETLVTKTNGLYSVVFSCGMEHCAGKSIQNEGLDRCLHSKDSTYCYTCCNDADNCNSVMSAMAQLPKNIFNNGEAEVTLKIPIEIQKTIGKQLVKGIEQTKARKGVGMDADKHSEAVEKLEVIEKQQDDHDEAIDAIKKTIGEIATEVDGTETETEEEVIYTGEIEETADVEQAAEVPEETNEETVELGVADEENAENAAVPGKPISPINAADIPPNNNKEIYTTVTETNNETLAENPNDSFDENEFSTNSTAVNGTTIADDDYSDEDDSPEHKEITHSKASHLTTISASLIAFAIAFSLRLF